MHVQHGGETRRPARETLPIIFAFASAQLGAGLLFGVVGTVAVDRATRGGPVRDGNPAALLVVAAVMTAMGNAVSISA